MAMLTIITVVTFIITLTANNLLIMTTNKTITTTPPKHHPHNQHHYKENLKNNNNFHSTNTKKCSAKEISFSKITKINSKQIFFVYKNLNKLKSSQWWNRKRKKLLKTWLASWVWCDFFILKEWVIFVDYDV